MDLTFNKTARVIKANGNVKEIEYFIYEGIPVVNAKDMKGSFCAQLSSLGWSSLDRKFAENEKIIFLSTSDNKRYNLCSLHHEQGHIVFNHPLTMDGRLDNIEDGKVSEYELEADKFAEAKMGKETVIEWLAFLLNKVQNEIDISEEALSKGWLNETGEKLLNRWRRSKLEIELRIRNLS